MLDKFVSKFSKISLFIDFLLKIYVNIKNIGKNISNPISIYCIIVSFDRPNELPIAILSETMLLTCINAKEATIYPVADFNRVVKTFLSLILIKLVSIFNLSIFTKIIK